MASFCFVRLLLCHLSAVNLAKVQNYNLLHFFVFFCKVSLLQVLIIRLMMAEEWKSLLDSSMMKFFLKMAQVRHIIIITIIILTIIIIIIIIYYIYRHHHHCDHHYHHHALSSS